MYARRKWVATCGAMAMLVATMAAAPASADEGLAIGESATMVARGAALDVPVTYTCTGNHPTLYVHVTMPRDKRSASTEGGATPVCDGTSHSTLVRVRVYTGGERFKPGAASVQADLYWWFGGRLTTSREVRVVHGTTAAPAADSMLLPGGEGTLISRGLAVDIPLSYTCSPPGWVYPSDMWLVLWQAQGRKVASERTSWFPLCDNQSHSTTVRVSVTSGTSTFRPGTALTELFIHQVLGQYTSRQTSVSREIRLVR